MQVKDFPLILTCMDLDFVNDVPLKLNFSMLVTHVLHPLKW